MRKDKDTKRVTKERGVNGCWWDSIQRVEEKTSGQERGGNTKRGRKEKGEWKCVCVCA